MRMETESLVLDFLAAQRTAEERVPKRLMDFMTGILSCRKWDFCSSTTLLPMPLMLLVMLECGSACFGAVGAYSTIGSTNAIREDYSLLQIGQFSGL